MSVTTATERGALRPDTIESRASWVVALTALGIYSVSFGAPVITVVALKPIARARGGASALAPSSSGMYLAGVIWPTPFERGIAAFGWRQTMLVYAAFQVVAILPAALLVFGTPPEESATSAPADPAAGGRVLGWPPRVVQA